MDWTVIGAVGEIVGATGVILSLLYLVRQIRSAALADQRARYEQAIVQATAWSENIASQGELAEIMVRGLTSKPSALSPVDRFRFAASLIRLFRAYETISVYSAEGAVARWGKASFDEVFRDLIAFPGAQQYWAERRHWFAPEMQTEVDKLIGSAGEALTTAYQDSSGADQQAGGAL